MADNYTGTCFHNTIESGFWIKLKKITLNQP